MYLHVAVQSTVPWEIVHLLLEKLPRVLPWKQFQPIVRRVGLSPLTPPAPMSGEPLFPPPSSAPS